MKRPVMHQSQLKDDSCVAACIAMVSGASQEAIINALGGTTLNEEFKMWVKLGYMPTILPFGGLRDAFYKVALVTVPSLNIAAGNHRIVFDFTDADDLKVHDPNAGRKGKKFYRGIESLRGWSELTIVEYFGRFEVPPVITKSRVFPPMMARDGMAMEDE